MITIWQLGNTGVRNPMRMQDALRVYAESNLVGQIRGVAGSVAFMNLLHEKGVLKNQPGKDSTGSYGRKWRLVFNQNGFTYEEALKKSPYKQTDLGPVDCLTPFGKTFLKATTVPAVQECFLRSMSMMMEPLPSGKSFSKLRWTLAVMLGVEAKTGDSAISFIEFATKVQTTNPDFKIADVVAAILKLRSERAASPAKRVFDTKYYESLGADYAKETANFREYGDMNLRYLRATGIVKSKGKGIVIVAEKHELAKRLASELVSSESTVERLKKLYNGPTLPTDDAPVARLVLEGLEAQLKAKKIPFKVDHAALKSAADINNARRGLEELLAQNAEEVYAKNQKNKWSEIADYMDLVIKRGGSKSYDDDTEIKVPKEEASAYFEWCLWRAFLAMNTLKNKPYEVRRFKIDQDFMPVSTAPGNGPDLVAEYATCVVVIEVTLSDSSRQEAMEGEPVRRHVADAWSQYGKPIYGLFVANHVDTNTAETFRVGTWYAKDDKKTRLDIVPMTLRQFKDLFVSIFTSGQHSNGEIVDVLKTCMVDRDSCGAPEWKEKISDGLCHVISQKQALHHIAVTGIGENAAHGDEYSMPQEEYLNAAACKTNYEVGSNA